MTTREDQFALDFANNVAPLRELLAEYADEVLAEYRGLTADPGVLAVHTPTIIGAVETPLIITASDTGKAAEKS